MVLWTQEDLRQRTRLRVKRPATQDEIARNPIKPHPDLPGPPVMIDGNFDLYIHLRTCVHGQLGPLPANQGFNTHLNMPHSSLLIFEFSLCYHDGSPVRYESLKIRFRFRNQFPRIPPQASPIGTPFPSRAPHVAAYAPWQRSPSEVVYFLGTAQSSPGPGGLTPADYAMYDDSRRLQFMWEAGPSSERSNFPTGDAFTESDDDYNVQQHITWNLLTDNPPLAMSQIRPSERQNPGYSSEAKATFAMMIHRGHNDNFYADLDLRVIGDVFNGHRNTWNLQQVGNILSYDAAMVFNPKEDSWGDRYIFMNNASQVVRDGMARWSHTRAARMLVLSTSAAFKPLRNAFPQHT